MKKQVGNADNQQFILDLNINKKKYKTVLITDSLELEFEVVPNDPNNKDIITANTWNNLADEQKKKYTQNKTSEPEGNYLNGQANIPIDYILIDLKKELMRNTHEYILSKNLISDKEYDFLDQNSKKLYNKCDTDDDDENIHDIRYYKTNIQNHLALCVNN
jgi:hypothetical protein